MAGARGRKLPLFVSWKGHTYDLTAYRRLQRRGSSRGGGGRGEGGRRRPVAAAGHDAGRRAGCEACDKARGWGFSGGEW